MNVLFAALHFGYFRNFESVIVRLAERGHQVHLLAEEPERFGGLQLVERLAAAYNNVSWGWAPARDADRWLESARKLRHGLEYVRFLDSAYDRFGKVRQVAHARAPRGLIAALSRRPLRTPRGRDVAASLLRRVESWLPASPVIEQFLQQRQPDLVMLASLTYSRSQQIDYLKAARTLGLRTAACVMGFDHLSSKAPIHIVPDRVFVWNSTQRREAIQLHHIDPDRVVVTGAQCYDQWFGRQPTRSRAEFCERIGLDSNHPYILYVCSAMSPNPNEARFVVDWIGRLRQSNHPALVDAGVLIRPHPERMKDWAELDLSSMSNVVMRGRNPVDADAKADYFDSLFHASAVVGLVTSAFLEAGIVGRPVHTLLLPQFRAHQEEMRHFTYLVETEGGLLLVARSFEDHFAQLDASIACPDRHVAQSSRFLGAFIRPHGLERAATDIFVDAVELLGRETASMPVKARLSSHARAAAVTRLAIAITRRPWMMDPVEYQAALRATTHEARRQAEREVKERNKRQRLAQKRRQHIVAGVKTAAKRALGFRIETTGAADRRSEP